MVRYWIDADDERIQEYDLSGVIHSATRPQRDGEHLVSLVDFGSAPFEAFTALLNVLASSGITWIHLCAKESA